MIKALIFIIILIISSIAVMAVWNEYDAGTSLTDWTRDTVKTWLDNNGNLVSSGNANVSGCINYNGGTLGTCIE